MNMQPQSILVGEKGDFVFLRVRGRGPFQNSGPLKRFLEEQIAGVASGSTAKAKKAVSAAETGMTAIEDLRRLFFTIVEHLKELLANQADTHDDTATLEIADDEVAHATEPSLDNRPSLNSSVPS